MQPVEIVTKNPGLKAISLVLAIILWLFVTSETGGELTVATPLEFYGLSGELIVTSVSAEAINVRINGSRSQLDRLASRDLRTRVDLSDAKLGTNTFDILARNITIPQGLKISQISPSSIKVELDQVVDRIVRIKPVVQGKPEAGHRVTRITVDPRYIKLKGARSQLMQIREVATEEIDISGLRETVKVGVALRLADVNLKTSVDRRVRVMVEIEEGKAEK